MYYSSLAFYRKYIELDVVMKIQCYVKLIEKKNDV